MKLVQLALTIFFVSFLTLVGPASALVQGEDCCSTTSTVRSASVTLALGSKGSSSLSSTADYGSITATAGLTFNEIAGATVSALAAPALDGSASKSYLTVTSGDTGGWSTTVADDIIYVVVSILGTNTISSVTNSGTALTWILRGAVTDGSNERVETWYAIAPTAGARTITVTFASSTTFVLTAFGISGANTAKPFDANLISPVTGTGSGTSQSVSVSTLNPNDFLIGAVAVRVSSGNAPNPAAGTGFTLVASGGKQTLGGATEYSGVTTVQSSASVSFSTGTTSVTWAMIGDAAQGKLPSIADDTSLSAPSSSGSFTVAAGSSAFLWSPTFPSASTVYAGSWLLDLWTLATSSGTMNVLLLAVDSSNAVTALAASGSTGTIGIAKSEVQTTFSGSQIIVPSSGRLLAILTNPTGSGRTFTIYWGTGQVTNFRTPSDYDYVLRITNSASSSYLVSLSAYSSSSISRITSMVVYIYAPSTTEIVITNGAFTQSSGPTVTLSASSTLYVRLSASANAFGSSSVVLLLKITPSTRPFCYDVLSLAVS
jgi:hypothetical protein